ncbi:MAG: hypothetical protein GOMPHAMPRED_002477 [Gomphillus americanus]|uniref:Rhodopsin domain-containing protein n=1 Tax=Gomphillus americanus TaxID=1940652 RepID=A0A8H3FFZ0_9LECA|nr:MAG: hypothetical protein GOMPHAMPRED_002477 [Gomphillus americanus]
MSGFNATEQLQGQGELNDFTFQASAAGWTIFALMTIIFWMRTAARFWYTEASLGIEDIIISVSWLFDIVRMITFQMALSYTRQITAENLTTSAPPATFWALFTDTWAFLSVTLPKIGVAFLLVRIFQPRPWVRYAILGFPFALFLICIVGFILSFAQCSPAAGQWDPFSHPDTVCWPRNTFIDYALVASSMSAFLDLAFAVYPGAVVWQLKLPMWKKLSTIAFMGLGLAAFAFAVTKVSNNATLLGNPNLVELYTHALHIGLWNSIEGDFVLIAACLPGARPWFKSNKRHTSANTSNLSSLKSRSRHDRHIPIEDQELGIAKHGEPPAVTNGNIHVKQDFSFHHEDVNPSNASDDQSYVYELTTPGGQSANTRSS